MSNAPLLNYASPPPSDPVEVHADAVHFHIGLPPVPNPLFAAMLVPYVVAPLVLIATFTVLSFATRDGRAVLWTLAATTAVVSIVGVVRLARNRSAERTVGATAQYIYFSDARTAGQPATLLRRDLVDIRVRRCRWQPWIWQLVAVPPRRIFVISANVPLEPVVLLFGLDRSTLERIAAGLRDVPKPPAPSGPAQHPFGGRNDAILH